MNNTKASYTTPLISNLIHQTNEDDTILTNIPSTPYDSFFFESNYNNNNEKSDSIMVPVQGDDPPQRLVRMPSRNRTLKEIYPNAFSPEKSSNPPCSPTVSSSSSISSYETIESENQQSTLAQENSPDNNSRSDKQSPFSCLVVFDALEHTAGTVRRGRPPVTEEYNPESQLRFVKPTVCRVRNSKRKKSESPNRARLSSSEVTEVNTFMASYAEGNASTELNNPIKKRGRKPKSQIQGNSFFVLESLKASTASS